MREEEEEKGREGEGTQRGDREGRGVRTARAHGSVMPANGLSSGHLGSPITP